MKKTNKKITVIRSGQERKNYWDFGPDEYCLGTLSAPIKTGDYTIKELPKDMFTIERKYSVGEIYYNLFEKRFSNELDRMEPFKYKFIICQFQLRDVITFPINSGIPARYWDGLKSNSNFIMSSLMKIMTIRQIPIIFAGPGEPAKKIAYSCIKSVARLEGLI